MKIRFILIAVCFLFSLPGQADEGMWMLGNLNKQTRQTMKELGLQMSVNKLYNTKRPSLKDAVVSFGGFVPEWWCPGTGWCLPIITAASAAYSNTRLWSTTI